MLKLTKIEIREKKITNNCMHIYKRYKKYCFNSFNIFYDVYIYTNIHVYEMEG